MDAGQFHRANRPPTLKLTTTDKQLQGNQESQTFRHHVGVTLGPENRVAKVTGSRGNNKKEPVLASTEEPSVQCRKNKRPGHQVKR